MGIDILTICLPLLSQDPPTTLSQGTQPLEAYAPYSPAPRPAGALVTGPCRGGCQGLITRLFTRTRITPRVQDSSPVVVCQGRHVLEPDIGPIHRTSHVWWAPWPLKRPAAGVQTVECSHARLHALANTPLEGLPERAR
jgi:hypothetical protein